MYRKENKEIKEVYNEVIYFISPVMPLQTFSNLRISMLQVSILFQGHLDLLEQFTRFLPASLPSHSAAQHSRSQAQQYSDRGSDPPLLHQMQVEKVRLIFVSYFSLFYFLPRISILFPLQLFITRNADEKGLLLSAVIIVLNVMTLMMIKRW